MAAIPTIAAALFASSPYLQTGPTSVTSILVLGALATTADMGTADYMARATLLALMVGAIRIGIGLVRAGKIVYLMSEPVLRGFSAGAAPLIVLTQLPIVLGLPAAPSSGAATTVVWALSRVSDWRMDSTVIAAATA